MSAEVRLKRAARESIVAHARDARPAECCGVLLGTAGEIVDAVRTGNLSENPNRFLVDPRDHFAAMRDGRRRGLDVVGFYHSHPHSPAIPSNADRTEATYPDYLCLIVGLAADPAEVRAFRLKDGSFLEVRLVAVA